MAAFRVATGAGTGTGVLFGSRAVDFCAFSCREPVFYVGEDVQQFY